MSGNRPDKRAIWVSLAIHAAVVAPMAVFARPPEPIDFETYRVHLVSPPPAEVVDPAPAEPVAVPPSQPEPEVVEPEPEAEAVEEPPEREPEKEVERPKTEAPPEPPKQTTTPPKTSQPADSAAVGGEGLNVNTEGREFAYPDYLANVLVQVNRYFRWADDSRPKGIVYFEILSDGSVRNIRMHRSSGNVRFDFAVQGAVETAGNRKAFGPLPEGYAAPTLPVTIEVEPPR